MELETLGEVEIDDSAEAGDVTADELDERLGGVAAYEDDAGLDEVVFARTENAGGVAHAADPPRRQSVGIIVVVFDGTVLERAATYGADVELEQDVVDGAALETFAIEVVFSRTELVRTAA